MAIDPACGSGHFLLGAARRIADRVAGLRNPDAPDTQAALRDVVSRSIHGVDRNPMAVELAKVALWIESVSPGQPLGFLDANIRCGDALLGVFSLDALEEGVPDEAYKPLTGDNKAAAKYYLQQNKAARKGQGQFDWSGGAGAMPPRRLASNLSTIRRMAVVRLLLNALTPDEIEAGRRAQGHSQDAKRAADRRDRIVWTREDVAEGLAENFGDNPAEEGAPDFWSQKAKVQFDAEDPDIEEKAATAERLVEEQRDVVTKIETRLEVIAAERTRPASILKLIGEQLPRAELRVHDAQNPRCLSCGQIIPPESQAFIAERIAERDALSDQLTSAKDEEAALKSEEQELKWKGATANQELLRRRNVAGELKQKAKRFAAAKGYVTLTTRYRMYGEAIAKAQRDVEHSQTAEAMAVREIKDLRDASRDTIARLSSHFNAVVQWLLTSEAQGEVTLDDAGIHPQVRQHGTLTAAAVESLKVVAFDLAALIMGLEGRAQLPGFWLHDSPREADLGLPIYDRLFELARRLEALTPVPSFQYVVTTTTRPPEALQAPPWLRLTLSSAPAEHRLFARDL